LKEQAEILRRILPVLFLVPFAVALSASQPDSSADDNPGEVETCLTCHDGYDASLAMTPHHLYKKSGDETEIRIACTDCHHGDARHYNEDPDQYPMTVPANLNPAAEGKLCSTCHLNSHQQNMMEKNVHARNDVNCSGCHSVHASTHPPLLKKAQPELCMGCHVSVKSQFARPFRHPVDDAVVDCTDCHKTMDAGTRDMSHNGSRMCTSCHGEFQGPFPYEHQATVDYSTEEGGCMNCHDPHGSYLPRMLKQPYQAPDFQLCKQCHVVPGHQMNSHHGTQWANIACNECHVDIHGSYTSRNFLSESLRDRGCLKAGCHQ
jgi:DmsE family decaheme c-type cytochrome